MDGSNECEYRQNVDCWGNKSGPETRNLRNGFSGVNKETRFEILGIVFQKLRDVLVLQSYMWYDAEEMCVPDCIKCIQVWRTY